MLEDYDPYLANFVNDVGYCISLVFQTVKVFLGASYLLGAKIVDALLWIFQTTSIAYSEVASGLAVLRAIACEILEFWGSVVRAILLILYGFTKIFDAFHTVAIDLVQLYYHVTESVSRTVSQTSHFLLGCLTGLFTEVPRLIISALSMIGESTFGLVKCTGDILLDFVIQLVCSPVNAIVTIVKHVLDLIFLPYHAIRNMPQSSFLGLMVVFLCLYLLRRVIRYVIVRNVGIVTDAFRAIRQVRPFSHIGKLKNLVTISVSTMSHLRESASASSCKATCVICQDKPVTFMSNPCKHVCLCETCVHDLLEVDDRCPICRGYVHQYDRVFIS